jgi:hypothetical protein
LKRILILIGVLLFVAVGVSQMDQSQEPIVALSDMNQKILIEQLVQSVIGQKEFEPKNIPMSGGRAIVVLSISDGYKGADTFVGRGDNWVAAIKKLLPKVSSEIGNNAKWIKVDFVNQILAPVKLHKKFFKTRLVKAPGFIGIAPLGMEGPLFIPSVVSKQFMISAKGKLKPNYVASLLSADEIKLFKLRKTISLFRTSSYAWIEGETLPLYRGNRLQPQTLTRKALQVSVELAEKYLLKEMKGDGSYTYIYKPLPNTESKKYNILRHAGTTYSLLQVYEKNRSEDNLKVVEAALEYLKNKTVSCPKTESGALCLLEKGHVKVGANGLAILALSKYQELTGSKKYKKLMDGYARRISEIQDEDGKLTLHKQMFPEGTDSGFVSGYYPGEAIFGLMSLYELTGNKRWLDVASNAAKWLITVRDGEKTIDTLDHDHWLLYGLELVYKHNKQEIFLNQAKKIVNAIVKSQSLQRDYQDEIGSWYSKPRSTPAATRVEGLMAAYRLFQSVDDKQMAKRIFETAERSIRYQLATQLRKESVMYLQDPARSLGGFRESLTEYDIRIDFVQHNISALLAFSDALAMQGS